MGSNPSVTPREKRGIQTLLSALKPLSDLRGPVPLQLVTTFLTVASNEGTCAHEYSRVLGLRRAMMSRYVHELGDRARRGGPGLGLIRFEPDPQWSNRQLIYLTTKGHAVVAEVFRNLRRAKKVA